MWHVGEGHRHSSPLISINIKKTHLYKIKNKTQRLGMTNISVGTSFFLSDGPFFFSFFTFTIINSLIVVTDKADFLDQKSEGSMQKIYMTQHNQRGEKRQELK